MIETLTSRCATAAAVENGLSFQSGSFAPRWYVAYTRPHHEKRVAEQLTQRSIEQFLPLYESVRRWKDRRVRLELPLFPGYVFAHIPLCEKMKVLQTPGVVRLVSFNGRPAALPETELLALRRGLATGVRAKPHPYLARGRRVRVSSGPLTGLMGTVVRIKQNWRIVISFDSIQRSILAEIDVEDLEFPIR